MRDFWLHTYKLTLKELLTLYRDKMMFFFIIHSFSLAIYIAAGAASMELRKVPIAFVDEDRSILSERIIGSFYEPRFMSPERIGFNEIDKHLDSGRYTFVVVLPANLEKDILRAKVPKIQLNIDATRMSQAGIGAGYISQIVSQEIAAYLQIQESMPQINLIASYKYNPNLEGSWFGSINEVISNLMMLSILLAGAALMREREHGTIEHLLVMPLRSAEILLAKIFATILVILVGVAFALLVVVEIFLDVPLAGSVPLFLACSVFMLFATSSIGIFMGTVTSSMPQFGMVLILVVLPLMMLSGGVTPYESMPLLLQYLMYLSPTTHFIELSQAILFRGAGLEVVWKSLGAIISIGVFFFAFALGTFKKSIEAQN
ncbi:MAG: ABC transporter permease [Thiovulaceae bacterium]|jgi:ABC-2 type transport system permease protein|nr:ABC transporter permease [Sulfurimonadaceae bacterium]